RAVHRRIEIRVRVAVSGDFEKFSSYAVGTRFGPIRATIDPITTGGMSAPIQPVPPFWTSSPSSASRTPVTITPPSAAPIESASVDAVLGAMNAKEQPR